MIKKQPHRPILKTFKLTESWPSAQIARFCWTGNICNSLTYVMFHEISLMAIKQKIPKPL